MEKIPYSSALRTSGGDNPDGSTERARAEKCIKWDCPETDEDFIVLRTCEHNLCYDCFKAHVSEEYALRQRVDWPRCGKIIHEDEIEEVLGAEWDQMREEIKQERQDGSTVRCRWGNQVPVVRHKVNYDYADEHGNKISAHSAENLAKYRVRWEQCKNNFCAKCKIQPYHVGYDCAEFREFIESDKWRYWDCPTKRRRKGGAFKLVCKKRECKNLVKDSCDKVHKEDEYDCGHFCKGFRGEKSCLPCLHPDCVIKDPSVTLGQDDQSDCVICLSDKLGSAPCIQLQCKHIFHLYCLLQKVQAKWSGPRINLTYKTCPSCKADMKVADHRKLRDLLNEAYLLEKRVVKKAIERGKAEGIDKDERLKDVNDVYYNDFEGYIMDKMAFYVCYNCKAPYFGGMRECGDPGPDGDYNEKDLICGRCWGEEFKGKINCDTHGQEYIEYKCRYCWEYSQWFCHGNTHYCEPCHSTGNRNPKKCPGPPQCKLLIEHPDDGTEFAMGCGLCRNALAHNRS